MENETSKEVANNILKGHDDDSHKGLRVMHELEEQLNEDERSRYVRILSRMTMEWDVHDEDGDTNWEELFDMIHASAKDRAKAWLEVKEEGGKE